MLRRSEARAYRTKWHWIRIQSDGTALRDQIFSVFSVGADTGRID